MNAGCGRTERGRCSLRPPSSAGQNEDEAKEEKSQEEHQNAVQCVLPKGQGDNRPSDLQSETNMKPYKMFLTMETWT